MKKGTALAVLVMSFLFVLAACKENIHSTPPTAQKKTQRVRVPVNKVEQPRAEPQQPAWSESELEEEKAPPTGQYQLPESAFYVQVGAFGDEVAAMDTLARLLEREYTGSRVLKVLVNGRELYKVQAGAFEQRRTAEIELGRLRNTYPESFVIRD